MRRPYTPFDIIWIKNVTNLTAGQAYMNSQSGDFVLHFPNKHRTNSASPNVGEIILIYQKINNQNVFTHLVTPIDNIEVEDISRTNFRYGRNVHIIACTPISNLIDVNSTQWTNVNFQGISQGNACRIENISNINNYDNLLQDIWRRFIPFFSNTQITIENNILNDIVESSDPNLSVTEGKLRLVTHYARERNREIIITKKQQAKKNGKLICEACGFSFFNTYDIDFIECHHLTPISQSGVRETNLEDLALVCSNCHRVLHRLIDGQFLSISQLKQRIERTKK